MDIIQQQIGCIVGWAIKLPLPLILPLVHHIEEQTRTRVHEGRQRSTAPPFPAHKGQRRRTLSQPRKKRLRDKTVDEIQQRCPLLSRIPHEIREIIWQKLLGSDDIHLELFDRMLRSCCGCANHASYDLCPMNSYGGRTSYYYDKKTHFPMGRSIAILRTCRQIYRETITVLYSNNKFLTADEDCIEFLPRLILPQRIDSIQFLHFQWTLPHGPPLPLAPLTQWRKQSGNDLQNRIWNRIWKNLASMKGLRELRVLIEDTSTMMERKWDDLQLDRLFDLVKPAMEVTAPETFILGLPWCSRREVRDAWKTVSCQVYWTYTVWENGTKRTGVIVG